MRAEHAVMPQLNIVQWLFFEELFSLAGNLNALFRYMWIGNPSDD
jgi:hypothetical protein